MLTTSDRQPFYCQNTFYKQFISVYKFTYLQDLKTNPGPVLRPPPRERGLINGQLKSRSCNLKAIKLTDRNYGVYWVGFEILFKFIY